MLKRFMRTLWHVPARTIRNRKPSIAGRLRGRSLPSSPAIGGLLSAVYQYLRDITRNIPNFLRFKSPLEGRHVLVLARVDRRINRRHVIRNRVQRRSTAVPAKSIVTVT